MTKIKLYPASRIGNNTIICYIKLNYGIYAFIAVKQIMVFFICRDYWFLQLNHYHH